MTATPQSTPVLDAVHDFGVHTDGSADDLAAWHNCFKAAIQTKRPIHYPGADSLSVVSDTLDFMGAPFTLVGDGGRIAMMPGRQMPVKQPNANQQGRHLLSVHDCPSATLRDVFFDYQGARQPNCVGDIVRFTRVGNVDLAQVFTDNMRGLTTNSTPTMPETFALQMLHVDTYLLDGVRAAALDGAPTATGIVAHWCGKGTIRNSVSIGHTGQGFGTYGVAPAGGMLTLQNCDSIANGHGVNVEGGNAGGLIVVLDHVRTTRSTKAALCVNANPARPGTIHIEHLVSAADATPFSTPGGTADLIAVGGPLIIV